MNAIETLTIQDLAAEMSQAFESAVRPTSGETFRKLKDDAPGWMTTVCRKAHDNAEMLPDDWRYEFIEQALDALAEHEDADAARDCLEPDVYTSDLTAWLHSLDSRVYYIDDALREWGMPGDAFKLLASAQLFEKEEVFQQVLDAVQEEVTSRNGSGETDEAEEA